MKQWKQTTDKFGQIKQAKVIDKNALNNFVLWADENNQQLMPQAIKMVKGNIGKPTGNYQSAKQTDI